MDTIEEKAANDDLLIWGVSREAELPTALSIFFSRVPTDDEMRGVHELLARRTASAKADAQARGGEAEHEHYFGSLTLEGYKCSCGAP